MSAEVAFLIQFALILVLARALGELMQRFNQPAVLGELLAGILLGPSFLGLLLPDLQREIFGQTGHLQSVAFVGLVLLMLLTGLETDVRTMRNMGRTAALASIFGIAIPFASGLLLGWWLPESYVLKGRLPLTHFIATTMGLSAMPVIAKILMDLNLVRRDVGVLTLSAAVVDDTIGWIILAMISGMVTTGAFDISTLAVTLGWVVAFMLAARYLLYPGLKSGLARADHHMRLSGGELVVVVGVTFLCGAATEAMHVHAVFGAFVAGVLVRQVPTLRTERLHKLESVVMSLFAPLFFGEVGLRVDFTQLQGIWLPAAVIVIAIAGKVVGCFLGGILGRLHPWSALALGFLMSARGAVGLVVAKIGLDLGILNVELFSCLVLMAVVTSFLAPILVKAIQDKIPFSEEERIRMEPAPATFLPASALKILIPAAGGPNAMLSCHFAAVLCGEEGNSATAVYVDTERRTPWERIAFWRKAPKMDVDGYFAEIQAASRAPRGLLLTRQLSSAKSVRETILDEARMGYDFLFLGASQHRHPVYNPLISGIVGMTPCQVVIVRGPAGVDASIPFRRILVPTNGSRHADAAFEFAADYARRVGARVTMLFFVQSLEQNPLLPSLGSDQAEMRAHQAMLENLQGRFPNGSRKLLAEIRVVEGPSLITAITEEVLDGKYDLVVLGAENRSMSERVYFGPVVEGCLERLGCTVALVVPTRDIGRRNP
ncbi:MAG: sodium/hydrogen exchanger [Deltaproteobacteria bacterium]|nr:sodium/hydrogen exchanger [Deltaproteobacteria bacterium]